MDFPIEILNALKKDYPKISEKTQIEEVLGNHKDVLTWDRQHIHYVFKDLPIAELGEKASGDYYEKSVAQAKEYGTVKNRFGYRTYYWIAYHEKYDLLFWGYL